MDGALVINKPEGWTSHDVVAKLRRLLGTRKIGHTGTLDPFATGVLVTCIGSATRLVQFLTGLEKEYVATIRLGFATDTQDLTGKPITPLQSSNALSGEEVAQLLAKFQGEQLQVPPMYSAKKVGGERLHKAARAGRVIDRKPVGITIFAIEMVNERRLLENEDGTRDFQIRVLCSSGTYVRTLAHDLGASLGVGGHLAKLQRTAVGHFKLEEALTLSEVETRQVERTLGRDLISPSASVSNLKQLTISADEIKQVLHGQAIPLRPERQGGEAEDVVLTHREMARLCDISGQLIAIGEVNEGQGTVKPRVVFHPPDG